MKTAILVLAVLLSSPALAQSPHEQCMIQCRATGAAPFECHGRCAGLDSRRRDPVLQPLRRIDYICLQRCQAQGYSHGLCENKCSY